MNLPPLEPVYPTTCCEFSPIEQKLTILYANQEKIYGLLQALVRIECRKSVMTEEKFCKFAGLNKK
jgi:hypothetical protein